MVRVYSDVDVTAAFVIGDWVQIRKFEAKPKFNGFVGKIKGPFNKKKEAWPVKIKALNQTVHVPTNSLKKTSRPKERTSNKKKPQKKENIVVRKLGPRDIGRHDSYDAAKFEYETEGGFLDERGRKKIDFTQNAFGEKLGPTQIGKNADYDAAKFEIDNDGDFLDERGKTKTDYTQNAFGEKLGPTQIGKNDDYDAAKFEIQDDGDFLADRTVYKETEGTAEHKAGPVEIGRKRMESFQAAKYKLPSVGSDFLNPRGIAKADSTNLLGENERVEEIGLAENFSAAKYEIEEDDGIFAERGIKKADSTNLLGENERVEEIGFADGYVNPEYEIGESWGMHGERLRHYEPTDKNMVEKKQTVEEIGIAKGFKPYQVGEELEGKKKAGRSEKREKPPDSAAEEDALNLMAMPPDTEACYKAGFQK